MGQFKLQNKEIDKLTKDYKDGKTTYQLAGKYKITEPSVCNYLHRNKTVMRPSGGCKRFPINETVFDKITEESAYWAGFLMADGCLFIPNRSPNTRCIILVLHSRDRNHIKKFVSFLGNTRHRIKDFYSGGFNHKSSPTSRVDVYSKKLFEALLRYGLTPRKSHIAKASTLVASNRHFWRGVIDGDGCISHASNGKPTISLVGARPLLTQFLCYVKSVVPEVNRGISTHKSIYTMGLYGNKAYKMIDHLYDNSKVYLDRKYKLFSTFRNPRNMKRRACIKPHKMFKSEGGY